MKKTIILSGLLAGMMLVSSCGKANTTNDANAGDSASASANVESAGYESFKLGEVSIDLPKGMHRTNDASSTDEAIFSYVEDGSGDMPIDASVSLTISDNLFGEYTEEQIKEEFEDVTSSATEKNLGTNEFTYSIDGETIDEYHRYVFRSNKCAIITVAFTDKYSSKLGGEICNHVLKSLKFEE